MKIRIIAGQFGGRLIDAPNTSRTHPMGERIRNALFNTIGGEIQGAEVLDAFAGSGAVGLEALSRGAKSVTMLEKDRVAAKVIEDNCKLLGVTESAHLIKAPVSKWLDTTDDTRQYDIIFADPPYHNQQLSTVSRLFSLLKPNGLMILSYTGIGGVPIQDEIVVVDNRSYGNAHLTYFRRVVS
ncbi:MAG TPA: 16S rRNA (guanine(966)-N(2))-methyltransferase RsmD [Candidatus Saccharibacteria bacterium]|jgi:16S rRNA (guanine966-N2)-methyltransferase|nr:16S rRNA (guanine(966)-N(2))-methyltransferase RsmD [Candidatus Saccharibacteria bacterium]HMR38239.1 16S rRNA (guanine(966)-N(2))-methyltransferase RsmD [Candidatus Saccharibacteria bacterium]